MKASLIVLSVAALLTSARAVPTDQLTFDDIKLRKGFPFGKQGKEALHKAESNIEYGLGRAEKWVKHGLVRKFDEIHADGMNYELITHEDFPQYSIRLKEPDICDNTVRSYSGYLDIDAETHLFFWAFESRNNPAKDPVVLWLNGGPGCSSSTGLLFELGPCSIANEGKNVTWNKYSWTESATVIFLDQPVQVGYSYGGKSINNSPDAAKDVYAFLQLFYAKFPQWEKNPFHIAGESYAGTYIPTMGSFIHKSNKALPTTSSRIIPLESLLIGNGLTDSYTQFGAFPDYACAPSNYTIFDEQTCDSMRSKIPNCQRLTKFCYNNPSRFTCVPATLSCWQVAGPIQQSGLNPYDIRKPCDRNGPDGPLCYRQMQWMETYLNQPEIKAKLGAAKERTFESCNMQINQAFSFNGDVSHNTAALIPEMLEDGIRILIYAGEYDFLCNWKGNLEWTLALEWTGKANFNLAKPQNFVYNKKPAGELRSTGPGAGLFTFLKVFDAGHMVPYDVPGPSLKMFTKWINNKSLV